MGLAPQYAIGAEVLFRPEHYLPHMIFVPVEVDKARHVLLLEQEVIDSLKRLFTPHLPQFDKAFPYGIAVSGCLNKGDEYPVETCKIHKVVPSMYPVKNIPCHPPCRIRVRETFEDPVGPAIMGPWRKDNAEDSATGNIGILVNRHLDPLFAALVEFLHDTGEFVPVLFTGNLEMGKMDPAAAFLAYLNDLIHRIENCVSFTSLMGHEKSVRVFQHFSHFYKFIGFCITARGIYHTSGHAKRTLFDAFFEKITHFLHLIF